MTGRIIAAGVAVITTAVITMSPAFALVSFSSDTGTGFVGKGDVQSAFGWNNAAAPSLAKGKEALSARWNAASPVVALD